MYHDYGHCLSYDPETCPPTCFRAQLGEDLRNRPEMWGIPLTFADFRGTEECRKAWKEEQCERD